MHRDASRARKARSLKIFECDVICETEQDAATRHFVPCVVGVRTLSLDWSPWAAIEENSTTQTKNSVQARCVSVW
jgi:hypothetical protein